MENPIFVWILTFTCRLYEFWNLGIEGRCEQKLSISWILHPVTGRTDAGAQLSSPVAGTPQHPRIVPMQTTIGPPSDCSRTAQNWPIEHNMRIVRQIYIIVIFCWDFQHMFITIAAWAPCKTPGRLECSRLSWFKLPPGMATNLWDPCTAVLVFLKKTSA